MFPVSSRLLRRGWVEANGHAGSDLLMGTEEAQVPRQQLFLMCYQKIHTNISFAAFCVI